MCHTTAEHDDSPLPSISFNNLGDLILKLKTSVAFEQEFQFVNRLNIWVPSEESLKTRPLLNIFSKFLKIDFDTW